MRKILDQFEKFVSNVCQGNMTVFEAGIAEIAISLLFVLGAIQNVFSAVLVVLTAIVLFVVGVVTVLLSPVCKLVKWLTK